jgi:hypothetical protein
MSKILIACEESGVVRDAFIAHGHDAISCDIIPTSSIGPHIQGDAIEALRSQKWDAVIAFPPCTYLCSSGLHWNKRRPERAAKTEAAIDFFMAFANADVPFIAIENPIGCISSRWRKPDQIIQPYQFGHDASKSTCLWLKGLPKLQATKMIAPRIVGGRQRWANQTDSGQNRLGPSADRAKIRSKTYQGIADAMAAQWSSIITNS